MSILWSQTSSISTTGPLAGVNVATVQGNWTLRLSVIGLTAGNESGETALLLSVQDSTDGFDTDILSHVAVAFTGTVASAGAPVANAWTQIDAPLLRIGVASAQVRIYVQFLGPTVSASVVLELCQ
jgi:hypothetical protein